MTTITKIFVILVCLFAFIFTPVAVYFAGTSYDWKALAEQYRELAQTALAREMNALAVTASEIQHYKSLREQEHDRLMEARQNNDNLDRKIDGLIRERDQLYRSRDNWETSARLLTAEMTVLSKHNQELTGFKEQILDRERELQAANDWLTDKNNDFNASIEILKQKLYQRDEIIAYQEKENEKLRNQLHLGRAESAAVLTPPTPPAEAVSPPAVSPVYGNVTEVRGRMASIDVGSASGLKEGMTMIVVRESNYICDLTITSVTPNESVGEIGLAGGERIQAGDQVVDENSFQSRK